MMTQAAHPSIHTRVVESAAEFASLADAWEHLQTETAVTSVFQSFDWQYLWWKTYGRGQPLRIVLATAGEKLVGILPLYVQTVHNLRVPTRMLRLIGIGGDTYPDDLGPLLAAGHEKQVARELAAAALELPGWDVLGLQDMLPDCAFTDSLRAALGHRWMASATGRSERISYLELPGSWDAWLETLHRDRRWRIRNARKKLYAAHATRFVVCNDPATLDAAIDRLVFLHNKRWKAAGESHGFSTPEYIGFHRAVMHALLARDRLRLYGLEIDGQLAAMYYFYRFRNRVYLMQSGFDPDLSKLKPGQVLLHHIVEDAIREGHAVLDFLRGDHRYKNELATGERETVHVTALRWTPGALAHVTRRVVLPAAKAQALRAVSVVRERARGARPDGGEERR